MRGGEWAAEAQAYTKGGRKNDGEQRLGCCRFRLEFFGEHEGAARKDGLAVVMDRRAQSRTKNIRWSW